MFSLRKSTQPTYAITNENDNHQTIMNNHKTLLNKIHQLEETLKEKEIRRQETESGYLSEANSTTSSKFKPIKNDQDELVQNKNGSSNHKNVRIDIKPHRFEPYVNIVFKFGVWKNE